MKTQFISFCLALAVSFSTFAGAAIGAAIKVDSIRQDAPWSERIDVTFTVSGIDGKAVDVIAEAFSGTKSLGEVLLHGDYLGLIRAGTYTVSLDLPSIKYDGVIFVEDFSVKLTLVPSDPSWNVSLYRVYKLDEEDAEVEIITPAQILAGEYGTYHWSCPDPVIRAGEAVPYTNLVWTGVTQDIYKTSKLAMRYMPAMSNLVYICCMKDSDHMMEDNFYVAVYETTQDQWFNVMGEYAPCSASYSLGRPVENVTYTDVRGHVPENYWPNPPAEESFIGKLRAKTSNTPFDLPAAYRLNYAAQAGTRFGYAGDSKSFNSSTWPDNTPTTSLVDGVLVTNTPSGRISKGGASEEGTVSVGRYNPTVCGLYDIIGNVKEMCVDWGFETQKAQRELGARANVDPNDPAKSIAPRADENKLFRYFTGCGWTNNQEHRFWEVTLNYARGKVNPEVGASDVGFRLVLDAYGDEENVETILSDVAPAFSAAVPVFLQPNNTFFYSSATNSTFDISWVFPNGATKANLTVSGIGAESPYEYSDLTVTNMTLELPEVLSARQEDVYNIVLTFDDGTVKSCQIAVVRGAQEGSEAVIDYVSSRSPAWHWLPRKAIFPCLPDAKYLVIDGVTNKLNGAQWYSYLYPGSAETSSVSLSVGELEYSNDLRRRNGMVIKFQ